MRSLLSVVLLAIAATTGLAEAQEVTRKTCGSVSLATHALSDSELELSELSISDSGGKQIAPSMMVAGAIRPLCKSGVIALIDDNTEYGPGPSFLIDLGGRTLASFEFGYVREIGVDKGERFFWVQAVGFRTDHYVTGLWVVDAAGTTRLHKDFDHKTSEPFVYNGETVRIDVLEPAPPG